MIEALLGVAQETPKFWGGFRFPLLTGLIALLITWGLTPLVRTLAFKFGAVDDPKRDDRRIHKEPLPRWGGIAIYIGITVAILSILPFAYPKSTQYPLYLIGMILIGLGLVVAGVLDDLYQYSAKIQLLILLGAGVAIQYFAGALGQVHIKTIGIPFSDNYISLAWAAVPLTAIYIFVVTKTMDTIDGVDGLASGIAAISAGTLMTIAVYEGQPRVAIIAAAGAGA